MALLPEGMKVQGNSIFLKANLWANRNDWANPAQSCPQWGQKSKLTHSYLYSKKLRLKFAQMSLFPESE